MRKASWLLKLLVFLTSTTFVLIGYFFVTNAQHKAAWEQYRKAAAKRGLPMSPEQVIPAPVSSESNFANVAFFEPLFEFVPGTQTPANRDDFHFVINYLGEPASLAQLAQSKEALDNSWVRRTVSLQPVARRIVESTRWIRRQEAEPGDGYIEITNEQQAAKVVLAYLADVQQALDQVQEGASRPFSRFPVSYDFPDPANMLLPHLPVLKQLNYCFQLRAYAHLRTGNYKAAASDIHLQLRLGDALMDEPTIVSHLVRIVMYSESFGPLAEGIRDGAWTDQQLAEFQERYLALQLMPAAKEHLTGDVLVFGLGIIDAAERGVSTADSNDYRVFKLLPAGWFRAERVQLHSRLCRFLDAFDLEKPLDPAAIQRVSASLPSPTSQARQLCWDHDVLARMCLGNPAIVIMRTAAGQTCVQMAGLACALERHRLKHGEYPERLEELSGIPDAARVDVVLGGPLHYEREENNSYVVYSVGWNAKDEGGTPENERATLDPKALDWVWRPLPPKLRR